VAWASEFFVDGLGPELGGRRKGLTNGVRSRNDMHFIISLSPTWPKDIISMGTVSRNELVRTKQSAH
jgi:hypothetical protein